MEGLLDVTYRLRALGAIALSLCQVAAGRVDGMVSLRACRSFDAAAGVLVVREAGGHAAFPECDLPLGMPLDLKPHSPVVAARSAETLSVLAGVPV
jgi:myo-inositol-1(or 4)-monophosphatase